MAIPAVPQVMSFSTRMTQTCRTNRGLCMVSEGTFSTTLSLTSSLTPNISSNFRLRIRLVWARQPTLSLTLCLMVSEVFDFLCDFQMGNRKTVIIFMYNLFPSKAAYCCLNNGVKTVTHVKPYKKIINVRGRRRGMYNLLFYFFS